jgi:hypothetical protein
LSRYYGRNPEQVQDFAGPNGGACSLSDRLLGEGTKTMEFKKTKKTYIMSFTTQQPNSEIHAILSNAAWQHLMISNDHFGEVNSLEKLTYERVESSAKTGPGDTPALRLKAFREWANSKALIGLYWHDHFFFEPAF